MIKNVQQKNCNENVKILHQTQTKMTKDAMKSRSEKKKELVVETNEKRDTNCKQKNKFRGQIIRVKFLIKIIIDDKRHSLLS